MDVGIEIDVPVSAASFPMPEAHGAVEAGYVESGKQARSEDWRDLPAVPTLEMWFHNDSNRTLAGLELRDENGVVVTSLVDPTAGEARAVIGSFLRHVSGDREVDTSR